ncbi:NAD(P)H-binding protein [Streptomyces sp. NPDC003444]
MMLITRATGNVGSALLHQLHRTAAGPLRALTRDAGRARFPRGVDAVEGDLARPASLRPALSGVRSLFLVPGDCAEAGVLEEARRAGVEHVVLVSSITVQTHPHLPAAGENASIERALRDSAMAWTILRPTQFASNALLWSASIREEATVRAPYPDVGLPTIHPADVASVARVCLSAPRRHAGLVHALTGPERISARRQAAVIGAALGRELAFEEIGRKQAHRRLAPVLGARSADAVLDLLGGDVNEELLKVRDTVRRLTGSTRTFAQWAGENAAAFRAAPR